MTDKVQKIREEVERIQLYTQSEVLKQVLDYIDSLQKEPVSDNRAEIDAEVINWANLASIRVLESEKAERMIRENFDIGEKVKLIIVKEDRQ